jgi:Chaperone of endosialidase/Head domain of trimeric autotransporter adhesin
MKRLIITFLLFAFLKIASAQNSSLQGISYQGVIRNNSGVLLNNQNVSLRLGIYSPTIAGNLSYQETHNVITNSLGLFYVVIGKGQNTGLGSASNFSSIEWNDNSHSLKIEADQTGGNNFILIDTLKFWSVPYALNSKTANSLSRSLRLNELGDVDTIGVQNGYVLKWDGQLWLPAPDNNSDTALYAANANHSNYADTANYALNITCDSALYANQSGYSSQSNQSNSSINSGHSNYCDTAMYAINTTNQYNYWNLNGNNNISASNFIGTTNASDLIFKTSNTERMRITSAGKIGIGTNAPTADLHIIGENGIISEGTFGSGTVVPPTTAGTRLLWYPKKGAFRAGGVAGSNWSDANIGNYSFAAGYNNRASGQYSTAFGTSSATGDYSFAACQGSNATGLSAVAIGASSSASGAYSIALGRANNASDTASLALGYTSIASGKYAITFGYHTKASGPYSLAMGYYANTNGKSGSFVYADYQYNNPTELLSTADNQFMVRASGGYYLYTNAALTAGVTLAAGGGSWSSVSDKRKKEHFKKENASEILKKVAALDVTSWNYKSQISSIRHIGPMAQDFYAAFGFGESDTTLTTVDVDGINLISIQALAQKADELKKKSEELELLKHKLNQLQNEKALLEKRLTAHK